MRRNIYLALGDSITVGYDASHRTETYIYHVFQVLRSRSFATQPLVIAKNGWDSNKLLQAMASLPPDIWDRIAVCTLLVGGNDLRDLLKKSMWGQSSTPLTKPMIEAQVRRFERNYHLIAAQLHRQVPTTIAMTVYNPIPNSPLAEETFRQMNRKIHKAAQTYNFHLVDIEKTFLGHEHRYIHRYQSGHLQDLMRLFSRPIHPNDAGHAAIAKAIIAKLPQEPEETD